jgi:hypothetical protein
MLETWLLNLRQPVGDVGELGFAVVGESF